MVEMTPEAKSNRSIPATVAWRMGRLFDVVRATVSGYRLRMEDVYGLGMILVSAIYIFFFPPNTIAALQAGKPMAFHATVLIIIMFGVCGYELTFKKVSDYGMRVLLLPIAVMAGLMTILALLTLLDRPQAFANTGIIAVFFVMLAVTGYLYVNNPARERP